MAPFRREGLTLLQVRHLLRANFWPIASWGCVVLERCIRRELMRSTEIFVLGEVDDVDESLALAQGGAKFTDTQAEECPHGVTFVARAAL